MQVADIGGRRLHHALSGPEGAPALVLVNSLGTDLRLWDGFLPHLAGRWRVLRWDFAGHGLSEPMTGRYSIEGHAADLAALMRICGIGRAAVLGVSVGGLIAQALATAEPSMVRGLVLADTAAKIGNSASWNDRIGDIRARGMAGIAEVILERWFPTAWRAAHPAELALWRMMVARQPADGYIGTCEAIRDADLTDAAARIAAPALVIAGLEDKATPPELVRGLARLIPQALLAEIEGAGHLPMVDAPEAMAAAVNPFLGSLPG